jgi:enoyl-[acyl-carrier-protein] reductase (NADH)
MYVPAFTERGEARGRGFPEWVPMQLRMIADVGDVNKPGQMEAVFRTDRKRNGKLDFVVHSTAFSPSTSETLYVDGADLVRAIS